MRGKRVDPAVLCWSPPSVVMVCYFHELEEANAAEIRLHQCACSSPRTPLVDAYGEAQGPWQLGGYRRL